jgi:hypothetical protein
VSADARERVSGLITGCWTTQVVHAAVKHGVVDALAAGSASASAIAARLSLHPRATFRLLRALAGLGLCAHEAEDAFALTEEGRLLASDATGSLRVYALHWGGRTWSALGQLEATLKTGAPFQDSGRDGFLSMKDKPDQAHVFNMSMVRLTREVAPEIVAAYDFSAALDVVDLGGGYGALLAAVLHANPHLTGAAADLAYMEEEALRFLAAEDVGGRARFVAVDFFDAVPAGADVYLLKFIIHDWDDADAIAILRVLAAAMGPDAKALVVERLAPERAEAGARHEAVLRGDIQMMVSTGGVERTEAEYDALFAAAGLRRTRTIPTASAFSILEAVRAS